MEHKFKINKKDILVMTPMYNEFLQIRTVKTELLVNIRKSSIRKDYDNNKLNIYSLTVDIEIIYEKEGNKLSKDIDRDFNLIINTIINFKR